MCFFLFFFGLLNYSIDYLGVWSERLPLVLLLYRFTAQDMEVQLTNELTGSLRTLKVHKQRNVFSCPLKSSLIRRSACAWLLIFFFTVVLSQP